MKLVSLRLQNFRSFEHCSLELQREGLIGVSGPNGAGKSTLLAAINYALFGRGTGSRDLKPERDDLPPRARCEVELEFILDERAYKVVRGPNRQKLIADGEAWISNGQSELTAAITKLLGIGKANFAMTFYARQRELQALRGGDKRKDQLETLLGLDRIKNACDLAHSAESSQEKVVRALEAQLPPIADLEARLRQVEADAQLRTPSVELARAALDQSANAREKARVTLTDARERAASALALEGKVAVAASELAAAVEREQATSTALTSALGAASEVAELSSVAAKANELRARDRALELEAHAAAQAEFVRDKRHIAQLAAVAASDKLAEGEDPTGRLAIVQNRIGTLRAEHERVTGEILDLSSRQESVRTAAAETANALADAHRAVALDAKIQALDNVRTLAGDRAARIATLEAEAVQLTERAVEEREHYEQVIQDGRDAICPRCKAPYGDRWEQILAEFEQTLVQSTQRKTDITNELARLGEAREADVSKLKQLATIEGERGALGKVGGDLPFLEKAAQLAAIAASEHAKSYATLSEKRGVLSGDIATDEQEVAGLQEQATARNELTVLRREAEHEIELFDKQLSELSIHGYERDAHEEVRRALTEATAAEKRSSELRAQVSQIEMLTARLKREEDIALQGRISHDDLAAAAAQKAPDKDAPEAAERVWDAADRAYREADAAVHNAEQLALAESNAVALARADLETAQRLKGQVDAQRAELSMRRVVTQVLMSYRTAVRQEAVPSLEQETSELLRRTTRGRYSDVEITPDGSLRISDMGTHHSLERFSGGEQDLANLCMRLALSKLLARRSGIEARFIVLDEVFGSQDADRRRALIEALRELDQEFGQILIVSHFDDFMEHCDLRISVQAKDGKSIAETTAA